MEIRVRSGARHQFHQPQQGRVGFRRRINQGCGRRGGNGRIKRKRRRGGIGASLLGIYPFMSCIALHAPDCAGGGTWNSSSQNRKFFEDKVLEGCGSLSQTELDQLGIRNMRFGVTQEQLLVILCSLNEEFDTFRVKQEIIYAQLADAAHF